MGVITTISSGSARTSGFCAVVQSCTSEVAAKVRILAQYIFEAIRSSWYASPKFFTFYADTQEGDIKRLELAANQGCLEAQYNLGCIYWDGTNGVEKNIEETFKWFKLAADHGYSQAQIFSLACIYLYGTNGVQKGSEESLKWFKKAASQGCLEESLKWFQLAASQGCLEAQYNLGCIYWDGTNGVRKDNEESLKWFQLAANQGCLDAQYNLGCIYRDGTNGVKKNAKEGIKWFRFAENQENLDAKKALEELGLL